MFVKDCPGCGKEQSYKEKRGLKYAIKKNSVCKACSLKGNNNAKGNKSQTGKTRTIEQRRRMSIATAGKNNGMYGKIHSKETRTSISLSKGGDGILDKVWDNAKLARWTKEVKERDDYICQHCFHESVPGDGTLEAHHIVKKSKFPQYAYDVDNGISLCRTCHMYEHKHYG